MKPVTVCCKKWPAGCTPAGVDTRWFGYGDEFVAAAASPQVMPVETLAEQFAGLFASAGGYPGRSP